MVRTLTRSLVGAAALTGALTFGAAGLAGAATTSSTHAAKCTKAEARVPKIQAAESKLATFVTNATAREGKATSAGHPKVAARIGKRIARAQKLESRGEKLLATIAQKCGGTTPAAAGTSAS
jgi:hypothetical protein